MNSMSISQECQWEVPFQELVRKIGRSTRNFGKRLGTMVTKSLRYLNQKWNEGAEIYDRQQKMSDERYMRHEFNIRGMI